MKLYRDRILMCMWAALLLNIMLGCNSCDSAHEVDLQHSLTWKNYDGTSDPALAIYILDGVETGQGVEGFENALNAIETFPEGSILHIAWDEGTRFGGAPRYVLPYIDSGLGERLYEKCANGKVIRRYSRPLTVFDGIETRRH